jgi:hypothetical protein
MEISLSVSSSPLSLFRVVALENKFQQSPTLKTLHSKSRDKFPSHPFIFESTWCCWGARGAASSDAFTQGDRQLHFFTA